MLVKDITGALPLTSKAKKLLSQSTIDFFIQLNSSISSDYSTNPSFVEDMNCLLTSLHNNDVLVVDFDSFHKNGVLKVKDILRDDLILDVTKSHLLRNKVEVDYTINLSEKSVEQPLFKQDYDFNSLVCLKFLYKKASCMERGIPFELTLRDVERLLKTKRCYYSGVPLTLDGETAVSFDRKDSTKPYTKENTVACAKRVNCMKNEILESDKVLSTLDKKQLKRTLLKFAEIL
jgi:hypothetical protein